jgi:NAD(P)H dehydrogenase (quinone)
MPILNIPSRVSLLTSIIILLLCGQANAQKVLVAYYSQSGHTKVMAEAVARGVDQISGIEYILKPIHEISEGEVLGADAIILGSPVYNANVAPAVQEFINSWPFEGRPMMDKIGAAFTTGGAFSIGEELVMLSILRSMLVHGMIVTGGEVTEAAFGASAITGEGLFAGKPVDEVFLLKAEGLGRRVGELVMRKNF